MFAVQAAPLGLPAFPALACGGAGWDESIDAAPGSVRPRALVAPLVVVFALAAVAMGLAAADRLPLPAGAMGNVDLATRNLGARGEATGGAPLAAYVSVLRSSAIVFGAAAVILAWAAWSRRPALAVWTGLAATLAFLPLAGDGMAQFAQSRSARPIAEALVMRLRPADDVIHEGPLENSASVLLFIDRPCDLTASSRTWRSAPFPERARFWTDAAPGRVTKPGRSLLSARRSERSVVRSARGERHTIMHAGGRWLYENVAIDAGRRTWEVETPRRVTAEAETYAATVILDWLAAGHGRRPPTSAAAEGSSRISPPRGR